MRMDHSLLRATGIVTDNLTGRYCALRVPKLVAGSSMKGRGNNAEWKLRLKEMRKKKKSKTVKKNAKAKKKVTKDRKNSRVAKKKVTKKKCKSKRGNKG